MEDNGLFPSKKDKMVSRMSHSHFDRFDFLGEGTGHFRSSDLEVNLKRTQHYFGDMEKGWGSAL